MRESELRKHAECSCCKRKIGHTGLPMFWTASIKHHGLKIDALQRQMGLTMMLGGSAVLAGAMGPDEDMTQELESKDVTLCEECAMPLIELLERCRP